MGPPLPRLLAGITALIVGIVANIQAIIPHYTIMAYDKRALAELHPGVNPGGPAFLGIPPINYLLIAIGCGLIVIGLVLIFSVVFRRDEADVPI